jgi:DNA uptake protein ComE-like DNA-binding protein
MWKFLRIDLDNISSSEALSSFDQNKLENLANLIIYMGGIVCPITLKQTGFEQYEILNGNLEYYASRIARERNSSIETISSIVINHEYEDNAKQQIQLLLSELNAPKPDIENHPDIEKCLTEFRLNITNELQAMREEIKRLEEKIIISPPSPPSQSILELLNTCDANQLKKAGIPPASVNDFLKKRSEKPFDSVEDIQRGVTGIGQVRLAKLIDYLLTYN